MTPAAIEAVVCMTKENVIQCNGIVLDKLKNPFIPKNQWVTYYPQIDSARVIFRDKESDNFGQSKIYSANSRFNCNENIIIRILSACPSLEDFKAHQTEWIMAGLKECARADHWYRYGKDYDFDREEKEDGE